MAKAVLVMDMPEDCEHCIFSATIPGEMFCNIKKPYEKHWDVTGFTKPDWCPLIPEPERRENGEAIGYKDGEPLTDELVAKLIDFGFNECLDEIEMMEEKNE